MTPSDILARVTAEANSKQPLLLANLYDDLERRLLSTTCSYAAGQLAYITMKLRRIRDMNRRDLNPRYVRLEILTSELRHKRYDAPCMDCETCNSRRRAWPKH